MKFSQLQEDMVTAVTSSDIAGAPGMFTPMRKRENIRGGDLAWHQSIKREKSPEHKQRTSAEARQKDSIVAAKKKIAKKKSFMGRLKNYLEVKSRGNFRISESFDMNDIMSRLSDIEGKETTDRTTSYGIEDDVGNLMKVTVRSEQAEEFETALAAELADAARRKEVTGEKQSVSMAELLLKLNDKFDIVDASFPQIPSDAVYNADKVQYGIDDTAQEELGPDDQLDAFPDGGLEDEQSGMDPMAGGNGMGDEGQGLDPTMGGEAPMGDELGGEMGDGSGAEEEFFGDDDSVEDFGPEVEDETEINPEENLLQSVLKMLTADAEARREEAEARAEEARAKQAEYSAMAEKGAMAKQEEVVRMEAEMERQKEQEKHARKLADLAKYRVNKTRDAMESSEPSFGQFLDMVLELEQFDTVPMLTRQRSQIRIKYAPQQGDDPETVTYKRQAMAEALRELDAKIRHARAAERYRAAMAKKDGNAQPQPPQTPQQAQMNQQQQAQMNQPGGNSAL